MSPKGYRPESRHESMIPYQPKNFVNPVRDIKPFAATSSTEGHMLCITWLLNTQPFSPMMELAWSVLDSLLLEKTSSPLRKALEDSNLGEQIIGDGLGTGLLQWTFAAGMKGVKSRDDVAALEELTIQTLEKLGSDGFGEIEVASAVNTLEFKLREGGGGLRGIDILEGAMSKWTYDLDPKDGLVYENALILLKDEINKRGSSLFRQMIRESLLENNHRVVLELLPSSTLADEQAQVRCKE